MKTAKEFWLSKHPDAEKNWQKTGHDDNFQVRMMEEYAKYYHEHQVKSVNLADVVVPKGTLCDLDGKTVRVKFKVTNPIPKIIIDDI